MQRTDMLYWTDVLLAVAFLISLTTGLVKFFLFPNGITLGITPRIWNPIHDYAGIAMAALVLIHLALHWGWIVTTTKRKILGGA